MLLIKLGCNLKTWLRSNGLKKFGLAVGVTKEMDLVFNKQLSNIGKNLTRIDYAPSAKIVLISKRNTFVTTFKCLKTLPK